MTIGPMPDERLEEIHEREKKATPGPWEAFDTENHWSLHVKGHPMQILKAPKRNTPYAEYWPYKEDAEFIVHAREDVRDLLNEVLRLQSILYRMEEWKDYQTSGTWGVTEHCTEDDARKDVQRMLEVSPRCRAKAYQRDCWSDQFGGTYLGPWEELT